MSENTLDSYRNRLDDQIEKIDREIDTSLTYISIGSLGFFLTINEKFLRLTECTYKYLLIISVALLLISFSLLLCKKYIIAHYSKQILNKIDENKPFDEIQQPWKKSEIFFHWFNKLTYLTLGFGVLLQVIFFLINISNNQPISQEKYPIKYEIIFRDREQIDSCFNSLDTIIINEIK